MHANGARTGSIIVVGIEWPLGNGPKSHVRFVATATTSDVIEQWMYQPHTANAHRGASCSEEEPPAGS